MFNNLRSRILQRNQRYLLVFSGFVGAWVRDDLFRLGHLGRPTYVPGDPVATAFNEGKRFMALHIASILKLSDEEVVKRAMDAGPELSVADSPNAINGE